MRIVCSIDPNQQTPNSRICRRRSAGRSLLFVTATSPFGMFMAFMLLGGMTTAAQAATPDAPPAPDPSSGSNIFSAPPEANEARERPSYRLNAGADSGETKAARLRKFLGDNPKIPNFQQIKSLPSLTPQQRRTIRKLYTNLKDQATPMMESLKSIKDKYGDDKQAAMKDPEVRQNLQNLRTQLNELRNQTWDSVKALLTADQMKELDAMRHGELKPATFNDPMTSA